MITVDPGFEADGVLLIPLPLPERRGVPGRAANHEPRVFFFPQNPVMDRFSRVSGLPHGRNDIVLQGGGGRMALWASALKPPPPVVVAYYDGEPPSGGRRDDPHASGPTGNGVTGRSEP